MTGSQGILERLPKVQGRYAKNADLKKLVWFRVGGPGEVLFKPKDEEDLSHFLVNKPLDIPHFVLGVGSNTLIRDGGIPGVVIKLGRGFSRIEADETALTIIAGGGALDRTVALSAASAGIGGLEFLAGIPGTIGGAIKMNAGAYGSEMKDIFLWGEVILPNGLRKKLYKEELGFSYRHSELPVGSIVTKVALQGISTPPLESHKEIKSILERREETQPTRARTGGSTFKNPPGKKAWELIDEAGCRGLSIGDAAVSEKHCNFLINRDKALANDLESLGELVRKKVFEKSGVNLKWEILRIGEENDA